METPVPGKTLPKPQTQDLAQHTDASADNKPHLNAAIRTAIEMGLFDVLNKSESVKTATELASITGGDKLLIGG